MKRFGQVGRGTSFICVALSLLVVIGMSLRSLPDLRAGLFLNPDTYMRLVRLRDILRAGGVLDVVARDGSGHGTVLHWSHLIDSLLCLLAFPLGPFLGRDAALHFAALMFGPLSICALAYAVVWAAAPFAERKWLFLGAVLPALSPAIASYGIAGVVHHHIAIVVSAVACWGWAARLITGQAPATAGIALGAWAGLGIWFTPESIPLTMMAFGALWLAWIVSPPGDEATDDIPRAIALTGLSFALVTTLALLVDPPESGLGSLAIDRLSPVFTGLALAVAVTGAGLWALHPRVRGLRPRIIVAITIGMVCCALWVTAFHGALFSDNMLLSDDQRDAMFGHIAEMLPVADVLSALHFLLTGACATLLAIVAASRRRSLFLGYVAICLAVLLFLGREHLRFAAYPEAAGAIALPIALTLATSVTLRWHPIVQSFTRLATILLFIQVPYLGGLPDLTSSARAAPPVRVPECKISDAVPMLARHPGAVVLAEVSDTPEILYDTDVMTVGSLYHRDMAGFLRLRDAWRAPPSTFIPTAIDKAEVSLVLACRSPLRSPLVETVATATLHDQLRSGHPPAWLQQIDENTVSGQALYRVIRPSKAAAEQ